VAVNWRVAMNSTATHCVTINVFYARRSGTADAEAFLSTYEVANEMYRSLGTLLEEFHAFICPSVATHEVGAEASPWLDIDARRPMFLDN
jgi:hypothetical protein